MVGMAGGCRAAHSGRTATKCWKNERCFGAKTNATVKTTHSRNTICSSKVWYHSLVLVSWLAGCTRVFGNVYHLPWQTSCVRSCWTAPDVSSSWSSYWSSESDKPFWVPDTSHWNQFRAVWALSRVESPVCMAQGLLFFFLYLYVVSVENYFDNPYRGATTLSL